MKIFAHRGASANFPENTLPAFEEAARLAVDGVELDVQRTKDGVLVVNHDERIHRTSNGKGHIADLNFEQLRKLDFGSWKDEKFKGTQIPTLEEVLLIFKHTHHVINIEIKTDVVPYEGIEEEVIALVSRLGMSNRIIYSSFDHTMVEKLLQKAANNITGALFEKILVNLHAYGKLIGTDSLHISLEATKRGVIRDDVSKGGIFRVYTVNREEDYDRMEALGVEAIFTDYAEKMMNYRASKINSSS
ncbi:MAG: glycerophosphodiester phosphodiesterase [Kurthia sp.]|nr:glycerophosphodiester phosphodiesterase [Candidatus Kurthia equi]